MVMQEDNVSRADLEQLLDTFPDQPLDFYGAIRHACGFSCLRSGL